MCHRKFTSSEIALDCNLGQFLQNFENSWKSQFYNFPLILVDFLCWVTCVTKKWQLSISRKEINVIWTPSGNPQLVLNLKRCDHFWETSGPPFYPNKANEIMPGRDKGKKGILRRQCPEQGNAFFFLYYQLSWAVHCSAVDGNSNWRPNSFRFFIESRHDALRFSCQNISHF